MSHFYRKVVIAAGISLSLFPGRASADLLNLVFPERIPTPIARDRSAPAGLAKATESRSPHDKKNDRYGRQARSSNPR